MGSGVKASALPRVGREQYQGGSKALGATGGAGGGAEKEVEASGEGRCGGELGRGEVVYALF